MPLPTSSPHTCSEIRSKTLQFWLFVILPNFLWLISFAFINFCCYTFKKGLFRNCHFPFINLALKTKDLKCKPICLVQKLWVSFHRQELTTNFNRSRIIFQNLYSNSMELLGYTFIAIWWWCFWFVHR